ncbi:hypothetical protein FACS1894109_20570 [Spirochaetia bacterium]|nr:hypothetical protein FACS1894109_20570 [Spirochaetia bacterium]
MVFWVKTYINAEYTGGGNSLQYKKLSDLISGFSPHKSKYLKITISFFFGECKHFEQEFQI